MMTVPLHGKKAAGRVALVDDQDYALVSQHRWHICEASRPGYDGGPYAVTNLPRPLGSSRAALFMHTLITGWPRVDHRNHDGLDNQRANLRPTTASRNMANSRPRGTGASRYKGVSWTGYRWRASIKVNGRIAHLGNFVNEEAAARAYDAAALAAWGEYAWLNFPPV
jgi:hypothetical protein